MKLTYIKNKSEFSMDVETIYLTLDNGNEVLVHEVESGVLSIENVSNFNPSKQDQFLGLMVTPQSYSTIHIIPEG